MRLRHQRKDEFNDLVRVDFHGQCIKCSSYEFQMIRTQRIGPMLKMDPELNVFGGPIVSCSFSPLTGFFRDGHCNTCKQDQGSHTVCAVMNKEFLAFSKYVGNDLSTPMHAYGFAGLNPGDRWCLCAGRFLQAHEEGCAPNVNLHATHHRTLEIVPLEVLEKYAVDA